MGKHRTPYPAEFRVQMVELVKAGRTPEELEKEFEPTAQTIYNWVAQTDRDAGKRHDGLTMAERDEPTRLRRENGQLKLLGANTPSSRLVLSVYCKHCGNLFRGGGFVDQPPAKRSILVLDRQSVFSGVEIHPGALEQRPALEPREG